MAIDSYSTVHDEFIGSSAAGDSRVGNYLIKAHLGHVAIHSRQSTPLQKAQASLEGRW